MTSGTLTDDAIAAAMERAITRLRADQSRPQRLMLMPIRPGGCPPRPILTV
jgi:hypothetical protein